VRDDYVSASRSRDLVAEAMTSVLVSFVPVRPGVWSRALSEEIQAMYSIDAWKGAHLSIGYGISCSWIPMRAGDRDPYHWPTARRMMRRHLFVDHFTAHHPRTRHISRLTSEGSLRTTAHAAAREAGRRAEKWWATVGSATGVLAEARRQATNPDDIHHPRAQFVVAFTLARLGRLDEALEAFASLDLERDETAEIAQRLAGELQSVAERARSSAGQ
jgi:hypothetical protein